MIHLNTTETRFHHWMVQCYSQIPLIKPLKSDLLLKSIFRYHWEYHWIMFYHWVVQWYCTVFSSTIENTTEIWFIVEKYVPIPLRVPLKQVLSLSSPMYSMVFWNTIENTTEVWFIVEKYVPIPLRVPLKQVLSLSSPMVFNGILKYHWEYHWSLIYCWKVCSDTFESTTEKSVIIE